MSELRNAVDKLESGEITRGEFIRRSLALGLSLSSIGLILEACGRREGGESPSGTLKLGVYDYIPEVVPLDQIVQNYESKNPDVKIEVRPIPGTQMQDIPQVVQKYSLEARRNKATYDLIMGMTPWLEVAPLAEAGALAPLNDYIPEDVLSAMPEPVREENVYQDGKIYGLPFWTDIVGFIYRKDYLKQATGSDEPPNTWDGVLSTAEKVRGALGNKVSAYGADWVYAHRMFLPLLVTFTDNPYTEEGLWNLDDEAATTALEWIKRLYPFMPKNSQQDLGSSASFQAGNLAMETYWQAQMQRAITAGVPEKAVGLASNPRGDFNSTVFWTTGAVVQKASQNKEEAVRFMVNGFLNNEFAMQKSYETAFKVVPYNFASEYTSIPEWARPLTKQLEVARPIPMNPAFYNVEQPVFQDEVQKMILEGQSVEETRTNMKQKIEEGAKNG